MIMPPQSSHIGLPGKSIFGFKLWIASREAGVGYFSVIDLFIMLK